MENLNPSVILKDFLASGLAVAFSFLMLSEGGERPDMRTNASLGPSDSI